MSSSTPPTHRPVRRQETGLFAVVLFLGILLTVFGGSVKLPKFEITPSGERERVFTLNPQGEKIPVFEVKNKFFNAQNLAQLAKDTSFIAIMAVGMTFVIIAGQIELSVGSIYALASVLGGLVFHAFGPEGPNSNQGVLGAWLGTFACIGTGALCGLLNGGMITALGVHPFIITLGTMAVFRGIAFVITQGQSVGAFPPGLRDIIRWETSGGLSLAPLAVMLLVALAGGIILARLTWGRRIYAIGGNELASRYSGIRVARVKLGVFLASGLTAGIAAMVSLGYYGAATSGDGQGYELNVIAASVVGGASLSGGKGSALGAILGALIIQMISSGIVILGVDQNYSQIIIGTVVVVAVVLDQLNAWWMRRRLLRTGTAV